MVKYYSALIILIYSIHINGQATEYERFPFPENDADIVSPRAFLGYRLGERFTEYIRAEAYFRQLAEASPRVTLMEYGRTYEQRPLLLLAVSSERNIARLDDIRRRQRQLVETAARGGGVADLLDDQPVINSYSYNIHGNEASTTEAAMQAVYELATTEDAELEAALQKTVNLFFVCINPDGRNRYVSWYNSMARATGGSEPRDLEHYAPWPNGRTNHYWFDLNRDWVWGIHPESRGHTAAYQQWMPSVHSDYHEQGYDANYFTMPGTTPRNLLLPDNYEAFTDTFGRANIAEFDRRGISYFTRDRFDFFYPSYGSSYPSIMGAIGMLTEQGGIGAGRVVETNDGYILTLRQRVFDHYTTTIAQVKAAARNRRALQEYSIAAWNPLNSKDATTAFLIEDDGSAYVRDFLAVLLTNGVTVERTTEALDTDDALPFRKGGNGRPRQSSHSFDTGTYIIPTDQARHLFVSSLLLPQLAIEDSVMYDMSTWSGPLAYNLEAYRLERPVTVDTEPVTEVPTAPAGLRASGPAAYAYVIDYDQRYAPRALAALWRAEIRVRAALEPFTLDDGRSYPAGSLIVLRGRNPELDEATLADSLTAIAQRTNVMIDALSTGRVRDGYDLANTRNFPLRSPRVAMLVDQPFSVYTAGQIYWLFDWETRLPVTRLRTSVLRQTSVPKFGQRYGYAELDDYDVLILPDTDDLDQVFDKEARQSLRNWVSRGGSLVAVGQSAVTLAEADDFGERDLSQPGRDTTEAARTLSYADRTAYYGKQRIPGAALHATVDTTNPLGFGLKHELYTLKFGSTSLKPSADLQTVGRYATDSTALLAAGYAPQDALDRLAGNTWAAVQTMGRGRVVYFVDNPHYRMFWRGPSRLMQNAVMIVGAAE